MSMQQQMGELEQDVALPRQAERGSSAKTEELVMELEHLKELPSGSRDELKIKDKKIESLELELGRARQLEAEKDASFDKLHKELRDNKNRMQELEAEVEKTKQSESKIVDSLAVQTERLELTKSELEESRIEISSLHAEVESLGKLSEKNSREVKGTSNGDSGEEEIRCLKLELEMAKENLAEAQEGETKALLRVESISEEMKLVKKELKMAIEAEEKSTKAMEDLALALKEVATEANLAKENLSSTTVELERVRGEAAQLKEIIRSSEEKYQKLLQEAIQEAELHKNTANRLRVEAEESLLAWNGKEMGFVSCIKRAEEEKTIAQHQSNKFAESLKAAESMTRAAREETYKLRDILKQAVNEANAAKAAAGIARDENSLLKDCLAEKEEALHFLTRENERLRINETAAQENVKQLKRLLAAASAEFKIEPDKEENGFLTSPDSEENENKSPKKAFSFNLEDLKFMNVPDEEVLDEDPVKAEALKGSIFDANAETPKSEPHTPKSVRTHWRGYSSDFADDRDIPKSADFDHLDSSHDGSDSDRSSHRRRRTMFRRVGDLLAIRSLSFHRREPSIG